MEHIRKAIDNILTTRGEQVPDFVWNILEITNVNTSQLNIYYDFIRDFHELIDGDIVELGVYRGSSFISTALLLKSLGSDKKVYGFDLFSGFPPPHFNDDKARFKELLDRGEITREHYEWVQFKIEQESLWPKEHSFDNTSLDFVKRRIEVFGLDNIEIVVGDISQNLDCLPDKIMACLYDCDLYEPYFTTLPEIWRHLEPKGLMYFDEYYSLKYPGPRIAVNQFCQEHSLTPIKSWRQSSCSFERWYLQK